MAFNQFWSGKRLIRAPERPYVTDGVLLRRDRVIADPVPIRPTGGGIVNGINTGDVTLAGETFLTISGQDITVAKPTAAQLSLTNAHIIVGNAGVGSDVAVSGDVTIANTGAVTIANDAVTFAKFQNITDARLLGRNAGSTGDTQEITLGTNLSFTGTTLNATSTATTLADLVATYEWNPDDCNWIGLTIGPDGRALYNGYVAGTYGAVRATASHSTGKFYFEFIIGAVHSPAPGIGVGSSTATLTNYVGSDANAWAMWADGNARTNSATTAGTSYAAGDIVGIAVDFTASTGSIKFYKNNVLNVTYSSLTLGTMYPMASLQTNTTINWGRLRLKAAEQTYSPPAGYSVWL